MKFSNGKGLVNERSSASHAPEFRLRSALVHE